MGPPTNPSSDIDMSATTIAIMLLLARYWAASNATQVGRAAYPKLIYFNEVDKGNHFAGWQEPQTLLR